VLNCIFISSVADKSQAGDCTARHHKFVFDKGLSDV
jgi:hypothetical protein